MNDINRRGFLALTGIAGAGLLSACSKETAAKVGTAATPAPKDLQAQLTYSIWDTNQKGAMEAIIGDFNKVYPNIKVQTDVVTFAQYWTKLQTQAASDSLPDVFWMNPLNIRLYAEGGQLLALNPLVERGAIDPAKYTPAVKDIYTIDGTLYGLPKDNDAIAMYFNRALFAKAGVAVPQSGWTWADFEDKARAISDYFKGSVFGATAALNGDGNSTWYNSVIQKGGFIIDPTGKKSGYSGSAAVEGLQFWRQLADEKLVPSVQQVTDTPATEIFTSKRAAMISTGSWNTSNFHKALGEDLGVVAWPAGKSGNMTTVSGLANVVPAKGKNPEAAMAFLEFLGGPEAAKAQAKAGVVIPAYSEMQEAFFTSVPGLDLGIFKKAIADGFPNPVSKNTAEWRKAEAGIVAPFFAGSGTAAETANKMAVAVDAILAKA